MNEAILELRAVERRYQTAGGALAILRGVDLRLEPGEMVGLVAPSGAGKSTLLHIAGLLERPDGGEVIVAGHACSTLSDGKRTALRRRRIGFVYQFHQLLPEFSAQENVMLPQMIAGARRSAAMKRAAELLEMVGLSARMRHRPATLSGGEQQRVAIARAMANEPAMLLADEPTGNLDPATAGHVFAELTRLVQATRLTALIATHNLDLARRMDRVVGLHDGALAPWSSLPESGTGAICGR